MSLVAQVDKVNRFTNKLVEDMRSSLKNLMSKAEKETSDAKKDELLKVGVSACRHVSTCARRCGQRATA